MKILVKGCVDERSLAENLRSYDCYSSGIKENNHKWKIKRQILRNRRIAALISV